MSDITPPTDTAEASQEAMTTGRILFSFRGRVSRSTFWLFEALVAAFVGAVVLYLLGIADRPAIVTALCVAAIAACPWPVLAIAVKRCRDIGLPLWCLPQAGFRRGSAEALYTWQQVLNRLGPLLALVFVYGAFALSEPRMLSLAAIESNTIQTVIVGTAAVGMTMIIISGGIDLSVASIIAFSSVVGAYLLTKLGASPLLSVCGALVAGTACGVLNGLIITRAKLVPFIVTLGMMLVVRGAALGLAESAPINIDNEWIKNFLRSLAPSQRWELLPAGGWMMIILAVVFWSLLRYARLGKHTFAIGSNEQTARLCGVSVGRAKLLIYGLSGACAGLAGVMLLSRQAQGDPTGVSGLELDVIAAVVIGGGSLAGGEGSIFGSLIGALIMTVIRTGCNLHGLQPWVTKVVTGAIIIVAVALDRLRHRRAT